MGKRKEKTNIKLGYLNEINHIDRRMKRVKKYEEELSILLKKRELLRNKLKTKRWVNQRNC